LAWFAQPSVFPSLALRVRLSPRERVSENSLATFSPFSRGEKVRMRAPRFGIIF
jgi:hypothetical protein